MSFSSRVNASEIKASHSNMFNPVQDEWKPTFEYAHNPWKYFKDAINILKQIDCNFINFSDAIKNKFDPQKINIILDHHIDYYPIETEIMCRWESDNNVISSIYLFNRGYYEDTQQRKKWRLEDLNIPFYQNLFLLLPESHVLLVFRYQKLMLEQSLIFFRLAM